MHFTLRSNKYVSTCARRRTHTHTQQACKTQTSFPNNTYWMCLLSLVISQPPNLMQDLMLVVTHLVTLSVAHGTGFLIVPINAEWMNKWASQQKQIYFFTTILGNCSSHCPLNKKILVKFWTKVISSLQVEYWELVLPYWEQVTFIFLF